jgi:hypothetical protein
MIGVVVVDMEDVTEVTLAAGAAVILETAAEAEIVRIVSEAKTVRVGAEDEAAAVIEATAGTKDAQVVDPEVVLMKGVLIAEIVVTMAAEMTATGETTVIATAATTVAANAVTEVGAEIAEEVIAKVEMTNATKKKGRILPSKSQPIVSKHLSTA